jgi:arginyl-tRNA synthetase
VSRINHYGDFGLPIALVLNYLKLYPESDLTNLTLIYQEAKQLASTMPEFLADSKELLIQIQTDFKKGIINQDWLKLQQLSMDKTEAFYQQFKINPKLYQSKDQYAESQSVLPLSEEMGYLPITLDEGDLVIKNNSQCLVIKKEGKNYTYGASDLGLIIKLDQEQVDEIIYLTGSEQKHHFKTLFAIAQDLYPINLTHLPLGLITNEDGEKIKSRSGNNLTIDQLVELLSEKLGDQETAISTIKYFILKNNPTNSKKFQLEELLNSNGNTAIYIKNTLKRLAEYDIEGANYGYYPQLNELLLEYNETINLASQQNDPSILINYIYQLAKLSNQLLETQTNKSEYIALLALTKTAISAIAKILNL